MMAQLLIWPCPTQPQLQQPAHSIVTITYFAYLKIQSATLVEPEGFISKTVLGQEEVYGVIEKIPSQMEVAPQRTQKL